MRRREIEELQRRAEAHDRSHFGPDWEEELESILRRQFLWMISSEKVAEA